MRNEDGKGIVLTAVPGSRPTQLEDLFAEFVPNRAGRHLASLSRPHGWFSCHGVGIAREGDRCAHGGFVPRQGKLRGREASGIFDKGLQ